MSKLALAVVAFGMTGLLATGFNADTAVAGSRPAQLPALVFSADRQPALTGEVYRLSLTGKRVDLSRSPFTDTAPRSAFRLDGGARRYRP